MDRAQIENILASHRECLGKKAYLDVRIASIEEKLRRMKADMLDDEVLSSKDNDGQPHGGGTGSMVENIAIRYADGYMPPEIQALENQRAALIRDLEKCKRMIAFVDGWMKALPEKQRWVIQHQVIDKESWKEVVRGYKAKFRDHEEISKDRLKYTKAKALDMISNMADRAWSSPDS